ncbi:hypothetical protein ACHAXR_002038, partial [Thalassiosira sp. AJA248-18]
MEQPLRITPGTKALPDGTPLSNVAEYSNTDVLCGRGGGTNHHTGNNHWRALVAANKRLYISLPKKQKVLVAKSIVYAVRSQVPGGRFLQKQMDDNVWNDIGDLKATEKTSQALREGAPDIRTEMEQEKEKQEGGGADDAALELMALGRGGGPVYKPGQILPNGLITLDYEGVHTATQRSGRGPVQDGTMDINMQLAAPAPPPQIPGPLLG